MMLEPNSEEDKRAQKHLEEAFSKPFNLLPDELLHFQGLINSAVDLCIFCRTHKYPEFPSNDFFELTSLIDKLDTELRKNNLIPQNLSRSDDGHFSASGC